MKPYEANSLKKVLTLRRDNYARSGYWILTDGHTVTIAEQASGHQATASMSVPVATFNNLIRWYMKDQIREGGKGAK